MLGNPSGEEMFPNIQSKTPMMQLEAVSSCSATCRMDDKKQSYRYEDFISDCGTSCKGLASYQVR